MSSRRKRYAIWLLWKNKIYENKTADGAYLPQKSITDIIEGSFILFFDNIDIDKCFFFIDFFLPLKPKVDISSNDRS